MPTKVNDPGQEKDDVLCTPAADLDTPWPEQPTPAWADPRELCPLVHGSRRLIWGEGNPDAPLTIILDNPGLRERTGQAFVCGTRRTLRAAMASAGLSPADVFLAFLFKARPCGAYDREAAESSAASD